MYDKFHVIANYNGVINEVRRSEWRKAKAQDSPVLKGTRYILFRRPERRSEQDEDRLNALLAVNENLLTVTEAGQPAAELQAQAAPVHPSLRERNGQVGGAVSSICAGAPAAMMADGVRPVALLGDVSAVGRNVGLLLLLDLRLLAGRAGRCTSKWQRMVLLCVRLLASQPRWCALADAEMRYSRKRTVFGKKHAGRLTT